ncbi:MAG TPA: MerR family transcriptional regulator [Candidatus Limnocylindrales bacterium]
MYTIKKASQRTGIAVPTIRAWERRYGVVSPVRSSGGYRLYSEDAIERLRRMQRLVTGGWSASAAAQAVISEPLTNVAEAKPSATGVGSAALPDPDQLVAELVGAAASLDARALGATLDEMFIRGQFEVVTQRLLFPALRALGDAWAAGEVSVAGEHLASQAVLRRVSAAFEAAAADISGPRIAVGLPPTGRHEIGALAFATVARRVGLNVVYLGPDLPVADWLVGAADAAAVVVGVVARSDVRPALAVAQAVAETNPRVIVACGGPAAPDSSGILRLPSDFRAAAAALSQAIEEAGFGG